jgi:hypothetical protein
MGRRQRRRERGRDDATPASGGGTTDYVDGEGNVLTVRERLSRGSVRELQSLAARPGASMEDVWHRREELLFERLAVAWTISGLPLRGQRELLGRYRMADGDARAWVRRTLEEHVRDRQPEALE